jgi:hypothetical protein
LTVSQNPLDRLLATLKSFESLEANLQGSAFCDSIIFQMKNQHNKDKLRILSKDCKDNEDYRTTIFGLFSVSSWILSFIFSIKPTFFNELLLNIPFFPDSTPSIPPFVPLLAIHTGFLGIGMPLTRRSDYSIQWDHLYDRVFDSRYSPRVSPADRSYRPTKWPSMAKRAGAGSRCAYRSLHSRHERDLAEPRSQSWQTRSASDS